MSGPTSSGARSNRDRLIKLWDIDGKRLILDLGQHKDMAR